MSPPLDQAELRPLVSAIVAEVLVALDCTNATLRQDQFSYPEPQAASLLGVKGHVLRDARLRGEITATKVGGRISYETTELRRYLAANRIT